MTSAHRGQGDACHESFEMSFLSVYFSAFHKKLWVTFH